MDAKVKKIFKGTKVVESIDNIYLSSPLRQNVTQSGLFFVVVLFFGGEGVSCGQPICLPMGHG